MKALLPSKGGGVSYQVESMIIITTWVVYLVFLPVSRNFVKRRFLVGFPIVSISDVSGQDNKPGSPQSKSGTLFVFAANIATFALLIEKPFRRKDHA